MINKMEEYMMFYSYIEMVGISMYMRVGHVQMVGFLPKGFVALPV